ncbi:MAG: NAD(P)H-hydrate epimerase, partial [Cyanobacteria bacterium J06632_22]
MSKPLITPRWFDSVPGSVADTVWVTAAQMQAIEALSFEAGMPVAALMEKVGQRLFERVQQLCAEGPIGLWVGPGHNGGDALVVARELFLHGRNVKLYSPFRQRKPLPQQHWQYAAHLGLHTVDSIQGLRGCAA